MVEIRQSGHSAPSFIANGVASRSASHSAREGAASSVSRAPKGFSKAVSALRRWATEGAIPSMRKAVTASVAAASGPILTAMLRGRCAAPATSQDDPIAIVIAATAAASSRPVTSTVSSLSDFGSVLTITSVIAASVPNEPASTLHRS